MKRYAILIGVSEYQEYGNMPCAANDVRGMEELLTSPEHGLFTDPIFFDKHPHDEITSTIELIFNEANSNDLILLYYSGHGEVDSTGQLQLVTTNTKKGSLMSTAIPVKFIRDLINTSTCQKIILILDCCWSGAVHNAFKSNDVLQSQFNLLAKSEGKGIYILTASSADETAKQGAKYSVLTEHILIGIREGKADLDQDGFVSMGDLFSYTKESIPKVAPQTPTSHHYNVRGNPLVLARSCRKYNNNEILLIKEKLHALDMQRLLSSDIIARARQVIAENQQQRDSYYFDLLLQLCEEKIPIFDFPQKWLTLKSLPKNTPTSASKQSASDSFWKNSLGMSFVQIPAGSFWMGSCKDEIQLLVAALRRMGEEINPAVFNGELPQKYVTINQPFYLGQYQVTQKQWQEVMGTPVQRWRGVGKVVHKFMEIESTVLKQQRNKAGLNYPLSSFGPNHPMYYVNWEEVMEFISKLNTYDERVEYRLPTEKEWEYACYTGTPGNYESKLNRLAWFGDNSGKDERNSLAEMIRLGRDEHKYWLQFLIPNSNSTHEVGRKDPDKWGLYDMLGNVWEWCADGIDNNRIVRGGAWDTPRLFCRIPVREKRHAKYRGDNIGFRVVAGPRNS